MVTTLDKFDVRSVRKYFYELMMYIDEKSEGDINMVIIVASNKAKEINHILPKGKEKESAILLGKALKVLGDRFPELGITTITI